MAQCAMFVSWLLTWVSLYVHYTCVQWLSLFQRALGYERWPAAVSWALARHAARMQGVSKLGAQQPSEQLLLPSEGD
jgi:hypothetical protein